MSVLPHPDPEVAAIAGRMQTAIDQAVAADDWDAIGRYEALLERIAEEGVEEPAAAGGVR